MTLSRVSIDPSKCQGHGRCVLIAPDYFDIDDTGFGVVLCAEVNEADKDDIDEAVLSCPENAIVLEQPPNEGKVTMTQADSVDETTVELPPLIQRWVDTYNSNDLAGHVDLYTDDARIIVIAGAQARIDLNPDQTKKVFWEMETALDHAAPNRQVRVDWAAVDGAKVCIEATLRMDPDNPDADQPLVVHFSMDADGQRLVRDHTFIDPSLINSDDSRIEEAVRGYFSSSGPTHAEFVADTRRWLADDVVWIDRSNPDGVQGLSAVVEELERAKSLGIEYMSFEIYDLVVVGDAVLTRRNDRLHAADGTVLANLDMMGYNRVVDGKIAYGKDYHFETAAYDQTWGGAGE